MQEHRSNAAAVDEARAQEAIAFLLKFVQDAPEQLPEEVRAAVRTLDHWGHYERWHEDWMANLWEARSDLVPATTGPSGFDDFVEQVDQLCDNMGMEVATAVARVARKEGVDAAELAQAHSTTGAGRTPDVTKEDV